MTETSKESMQPSQDTTNVLPQLNENKGTLSLTLSIDKSVSKVASWVIALIVGCSIFLGIAIALSITMLFAWRDAGTEARMVQYYLMDPHYRTPEEMAAWSKFKEEHK